jgi:hypothetical protein
MFKYEYNGTTLRRSSKSALEFDRRRGVVHSAINDRPATFKNAAQCAPILYSPMHPTVMQQHFTDLGGPLSSDNIDRENMRCQVIFFL